MSALDDQIEDLEQRVLNAATVEASATLMDRLNVLYVRKHGPSWRLPAGKPKLSKAARTRRKRAARGTPTRTPMPEKADPVSAGARRPWCLPCVERRGTRTFAEFYGVACAVHHEMLDAQSREALRLAALDQKPKGGRITTVTGQIWAVRHFLRLQRAVNTVEATWRSDRG